MKASGRKLVAQKTNASSGVAACMATGQDTKSRKGKSTEVTAKITGAKQVPEEQAAEYADMNPAPGEEAKDVVMGNDKDDAVKRYREMLQYQVEAKKATMAQQKEQMKGDTGFQIGVMSQPVGVVDTTEKTKSAAKELQMFNQQLAAQKANEKATAKRVAQTPMAPPASEPEEAPRSYEQYAPCEPAPNAEPESRQMQMMPPEDQPPQEPIQYAQEQRQEPASQEMVVDEKALKSEKARKFREALELQMKEDRARKLLEKQERSGFKKI